MLTSFFPKNLTPWLPSNQKSRTETDPKDHFIGVTFHSNRMTQRWPSVQAFHPWSPHYTKSKSTTLACKLTSQTNLWASQRIPIRLEVSVQVSWGYWNLPNDRNLHIQNRMVQPIQKYLETSPMYWVTIINNNSSMGKTNICQLPPQCLLCAFSL